MKKIVIILALLLAGCGEKNEVAAYLESEGMTDIEHRTYDLFSCGSKNIYAHRFSAIKDGKKVKGIVCAEYGFKNPEVKFDKNIWR